MAVDNTGITSLAGLSTGLDTSSIVSQLTELRRNPAVRLGYRLDVINARRDGLQESSNLLSSLRSRAQALRSEALWNPGQEVASSDEKIASVTRASGSPSGSHTLNVISLARAQQLKSGASFVGAGGDDTLSIQIGAGTAKTVSILSGDSLESIAEKINGTSGIGVYASVISERLYLSGKSSGTANGITVTSTGSLASDMGLTTSIASADTTYTINGSGVQTASSNTVTDAVAGLSITLKGVGSATISVSESAIAPEKIADAVSAYVDAYNAAVKGMRQRVSEKPVENPANAVDRKKGALFSDSTLQGTLSSMASWSSRSNASLDSGFESLSDLGIRTLAAGSAGANEGQISFDRKVFLERIAQNPDQVRLALDRTTGSASTEGLSQWAERQINAFIGTTGSLTYSIKGKDSEKKSITDRQARINERADRYSAQLRRQYNALETAMSTLNSQGSRLSGALAQL